MGPKIAFTAEQRELIRHVVCNKTVPFQFILDVLIDEKPVTAAAARNAQAALDKLIRWTAVFDGETEDEFLYTGEPNVHNDMMNEADNLIKTVGSKPTLTDIEAVLLRYLSYCRNRLSAAEFTARKLGDLLRKQ